MSDKAPAYRTPYAEDAVYINSSTSADELHQFVRKRAAEPIEVEDALVWNFSTHKANRSALNVAVEQFEDDRYTIPYQLNQTWAYIQSILPHSLRKATVLRYNSSHGYYDVYRNFYQESVPHVQEEEQSRVAKAFHEAEAGVE